jgi:crossover junction endodeoxyribonuclease RuvC
MAAMNSTAAGDRIVGIDPGLNITGYGVVATSPRGAVLTEAGVVRGGSRASLEERLAEIYRGIVDVLSAFQPSAVAIEELFSHYQRPRTAILMGHARGVICLAAVQAGIPVVHYAATQVKRMLTGSGRAPKSQVQRAICREFGLARPPEPADVADALAIALCHYYLARKQRP